jgi:hypothetical protein
VGKAASTATITTGRAAVKDLVREIYGDTLDESAGGTPALPGKNGWRAKIAPLPKPQGSLPSGQQGAAPRQGFLHQVLRKLPDKLNRSSIPVEGPDVIGENDPMDRKPGRNRNLEGIALGMRSNGAGQ